MLIVLIIVAIIAMFLGGWIENDFLIGAGITLGVIVIIAAIIMAFDVSYSTVINKKIAMYKEENTKIENEVKVIVENYKDYEGKTLKEFKIDNLTVALSLYPELKTNELVKTQITIYVENNKKIKELKEDKLNYSVARWWLYFGK